MLPRRLPPFTDPSAGRWVPMYPTLDMMNAGMAATGQTGEMVIYAYNRMLRHAPSAPLGRTAPPAFRWAPRQPTPAMRGAGAVVNAMGWDLAHHLYMVMLRHAPSPNQVLGDALSLDHLIDAAPNVRRFARRR